MSKALHYKDVISVPRKCVVKSRSEVDVSIDFCGYKFAASFLPSNMLAVVNEDICKWLAFNNYFYIMHRFGNTRKFIQRARAESWPMTSISVGVKDEDRQLILDIKESKCRVNFVTIDIAHGYADSVAEMIKFIKENLPDTKVIAGNIWGDKDSVEFLQDAGADALKIGLSMGSSCQTFPETSFGSPMFSAAQAAGRWAKIPVIIDGGIKQNGDIARAMIGFLNGQKTSYSTDSGVWIEVPHSKLNIPMVMMGGQLAACIDAPGENIFEMPSELDKVSHQQKYGPSSWPLPHKIIGKRFFGSASAENKRKTGQEVKHIEGKSVEIPCNGLTYAQCYGQIMDSIRSQISYAGGRDLTAFKDVKWMEVS